MYQVLTNLNYGVHLRFYGMEKIVYKTFSNFVSKINARFTGYKVCTHYIKTNRKMSILECVVKTDDMTVSSVSPLPRRIIKTLNSRSKGTVIY